MRAYVPILWVSQAGVAGIPAFVGDGVSERAGLERLV